MNIPMKILHTVLVCVLTASFPVGFCLKTDINTDMSALLTLRAQLTIPNNSILESNWSGAVVCSWIGVRCGARHRRVTTLDLSSMGLVGVLPPHLGNLSFLNNIDLFNNSFYGSIPSELFNLRRLKHANLGHNHFSGHISFNLFSAPSLSRVSFENNFLTGSIPTHVVSNTSSSSLQIISLAYNNLTGEVPAEIFHHLPRLQVLLLSDNMLTGTIPSALFQCRLLQTLTLSYNGLGGNISPEIGNLTMLTVLDMSENLFSGSLPNELGSLTQLQRANFGSNNLTLVSSPSFFSSLANCKSLSLLSLHMNPLNTILPSTIGNLSDTLQKLFIYQCQLKGAIPPEVGNLTSLILLSLHSNHLSGAIPSTVGRLQKIQVLSVRNNRIEGPIPYGMCKLSNICYIYFEENKFSGPIPACLGDLASLRGLNMSNNRLSMEVPSSLWDLRDMLTLDLSGNFFSGSLPKEMEKLKAASLIYLSDNQFTGNIPPTLGSLIDMQYLSLANNKLDGSMPESLGNLISLQYLDLSSNNLSGVIPKTLEKLSDLEYFNVSINRLEGEIPDEGPFAKFSPQSFILNSDLCGSTRFEVPHCKTVVPKKKNTSMAHIRKYAIPIITAASTVFGLVVLVLILVRRRKNNNVANSLGNVTEMAAMATWRRVSYYELVQATNQFHESNLLGVGAFGSVFKGTLSDGMDIAVKVFKQNMEEAFGSFQNECEVMRSIRHMNLVKVITSCSSPDLKCLVMEYMPNGSLEKWLHSDDGTNHLNILQRLSIMIDVSKALEYLHYGHSVPIIHCDLKPSNVLLDGDMVAHVTDFGISKLLTGGDSITQTLTLATIGYTAPEYGLEGIVSTQGDVYSYGIMLMETFAGKQPTDEMFASGMSLTQWVKKSVPHNVHEIAGFGLLNIEDQHFEKKRSCISEIMELALACCSEKRKERPNIKDISTKLRKMQSKLLRDPRFFP